MVAPRAEPGESWGVAFTETVFDGVRTCRNRCAFCFMTQLPKGLRRALYLRDDDYRLSFLQGNFVTLTNLVRRRRRPHRRAAPLAALRVAARGRPRGAQPSSSVPEKTAPSSVSTRCSRPASTFTSRSSSFPASTTAPSSTRSLTWLAEREGIASVGIVPLGYTAHQQRFPGSYESPTAAAGVIAQVEPWQDAFRAARRRLAGSISPTSSTSTRRDRCLPADALRRLPAVRERHRARARLARRRRRHCSASSRRPRRRLDASGRARHRNALRPGARRDDRLARCRPRSTASSVLSVENRFFGGNVSVTGLLCAADLVPAIASTAARTRRPRARHRRQRRWPAPRRCSGGRAGYALR